MTKTRDRGHRSPAFNPFVAAPFQSSLKLSFEEPKDAYPTHLFTATSCASEVDNLWGGM